MATELKTAPGLVTTHTTDGADNTNSTVSTAQPAPTGPRTSWRASARAALANRRADRSALSRQITAYPATRSASATVVPPASR
jgi:hypothetical protein